MELGWRRGLWGRAGRLVSFLPKIVECSPARPLVQVQQARAADFLKIACHQLMSARLTRLMEATQTNLDNRLLKLCSNTDRENYAGSAFNHHRCSRCAASFSSSSTQFHRSRVVILFLHKSLGRCPSVQSISSKLCLSVRSRGGKLRISIYFLQADRGLNPTSENPL